MSQPQLSTKRENAQFLRSAALQTGGFYAEAAEMGDCISLMCEGSAFGTRPLVSKVVLELAPGLRLPCGMWGMVSEKKKPSLTTKRLMTEEDAAAEEEAAEITGLSAGGDKRPRRADDRPQDLLVCHSGDSEDAPWVAGNDNPRQPQQQQWQPQQPKDPSTATLDASSFPAFPSGAPSLPLWESQEKADPACILLKAAIGDVKREILYRNPTDRDIILRPDDKVKGYKYGSQYIPMNGADETAAKVTGPPGIVVIGTWPCSEVPRHYYMDSTSVLQGHENVEEAQAAVCAFSEALRRADRVAVARFVKRENGDPTLVALVPPRENNGTLLVQRLPCKEDSRNFPFASLPTIKARADAEGRAIVARFVDALTVSSLTPRVLTPANPTIFNVYADHTQGLLQRARCVRLAAPRACFSWFLCVLPFV